MPFEGMVVDLAARDRLNDAAVARLLSVSKRTLLRWLKDGVIDPPALVVGKRGQRRWADHEVAQILAFMRHAVRELGQTIVMVTHDAVAASYADRVVVLADGRITDQLADPTPDAVLERMRRRPTQHASCLARISRQHFHLRRPEEL